MGIPSGVNGRLGHVGRVRSVAFKSELKRTKLLGPVQDAAVVVQRIALWSKQGQVRFVVAHFGRQVFVWGDVGRIAQD
jgi:hypothetical protein